MTAKSNAVVAVFASHDLAEGAVRKLEKEELCIREDRASSVQLRKERMLKAGEFAQAAKSLMINHELLSADGIFILTPIRSALYERFSTRGEADFADKVISALRCEFGGHDENPADKKGGD